MPMIKSPSLPFTASLIDAAPQTLGVYALWQDGAIVYLGKACAGGATIRTALAEHFNGERWASERATRCSWEIADDAERRYEELLKQFEITHGAAPRWNDPQRLPTGV
jgi:hypothetical protein